MTRFKSMKALVLLFAFVMLFAGGFTIVSSNTVTARPACCIYVMYCMEVPPYSCWCQCIPVPCPK